MNDMPSLITSILPAFDSIAAILATLYISVAIFAAQNLFKDEEYGSNISGKDYLAILRLVKLSVALVSVPLLVRVSQVDILKADYGNAKSYAALLVLIGLSVYILFVIVDIFTQKGISKKPELKYIEHPKLRRLGWLILNKSDWSIEKRDLIVSTLKGENKSSIAFEEFLLDTIKKDTAKLLSTSKKTREKGDYVTSILSVLVENWDKRPLGYGTYYDDLLSFLLESWKKVTEDRQLYHDGNIYNLQITLAKTINSLWKYSLAENRFSFELFENLKKFVPTLEDKTVKEFLRQLDDSALFEGISNSPENYIIWSDYFPGEWKLTFENLVEKPNSVAIIIYNRFMKWAQDRLLGDGEIDEVLDDVSTHLFEGIDPIAWARLIEYRYAPWVGHEHLRYVIGKSGTHGFAKFYSTQDWVDDENKRMERIQKEDEAMRQATFKLVAGLGIYNQKMIEDALLQVTKLEKDKKLDDSEKTRLSRYKRLFSDLKEYLGKK